MNKKPLIVTVCAACITVSCAAVFSGDATAPLIRTNTDSTKGGGIQRIQNPFKEMGVSSYSDVTEEQFETIRNKAIKGNKNAQFVVGMLFLHETSIMKVDSEKAVAWFKKAADNNSCEAQYILGKIYYEGKFAEKDIEQAKAYLRRAVASGNKNAKTILDSMPNDAPKLSADQKNHKRIMSLFENDSEAPQPGGE